MKKVEVGWKSQRLFTKMSTPEVVKLSYSSVQRYMRISTTGEVEKKIAHNSRNLRPLRKKICGVNHPADRKIALISSIGMNPEGIFEHTQHFDCLITQALPPLGHK